MGTTCYSQVWAPKFLGNRSLDHQNFFYSIQFLKFPNFLGFRSLEMFTALAPVVSYFFKKRYPNVLYCNTLQSDLRSHSWCVCQWACPTTSLKLPQAFWRGSTNVDILINDHLPSISSMFYERLFCTKVFSAAFL